MIRQFMTLVLISLLLMSLAPLTLAEEGSGDTEVKSGSNTGESTTDRMEAKKEQKTELRILSEGANGEKVEQRLKIREKAFGLDVSSCMQDLLKGRPNLLRDEAQRLCLSKDFHKVELKDQQRRLKEANKEEFLALHRGNVQEALERCQAKLDTEEARRQCEERLKTRLEKLSEVDEQRLERLKSLEERRLEVRSELKDLEKKENFVKFKAEREFKARALDKIQKERARQNFLEAKEHFEEAKEKFSEAKEVFDEAKKTRAACTENCDALEQDLLARAKAFLTHSADVLLDHLAKVKTKVQENEHLSEEEVQEIVSAIDAKMAEVDAIVKRIEAATTRQELVDAAKALHAVWKPFKERVKAFVGRTVNARIGGIIVKSKHLEEKLDRVLARMEENGKDTAALDPLITDFHASVELARQKYEAAQQKFLEAKASAQPSSALIKDAQALMKEAHEALKKANETLRAIMKTLKEDGEDEFEEVGDLEEVEDEDEDEEEEVEDEDEEEEA